MARPALYLVPPPEPETVRDPDAEARVAFRYLTDDRVRRTVEFQPNRMITLTRADGTPTRQVTAAYFQAAILEKIAREKVIAETLADPEKSARERAWADVHARRASGLPDLCATCGAALGMGKSSLLRRTLDPGTWACRPCTLRKAVTAMTPEQRSERAKKINAALTPEQRSEAARKRQAALTPEQRSERGRKAQAGLTPEQRSENARKRNAALTPEQRSERGRKAQAALTPEQRSEATRKANATRKARRAP